MTSPQSSFNNSTSGLDDRCRQRSPIPHIRIQDSSSIQEKYLVKHDQILGKGSFGTVILANDSKTGECFAIKKVNKEKAGTMGLKLLQREVDILKRVRHPSIIVLHGIFETHRSMYLVFDYCDRGDLKKQLTKRGRFLEEEAKEIFKKIVEAVRYVHQADIIHRDLKLENILCKSQPAADTEKHMVDFDIRLIDFGLSVIKDGQDSMIDTWVGTPLYMAPEVVKNTGYNHLCDVWSLGVILFQLLSKTFPFYSDNEDTLYKLICAAKPNFNKPHWVSISDAAKHLIIKMLHPVAAHRLSTGEVLDHSFLTGTEWSDPKEQPTNVLEMMAAWKDDLAGEDSHPNCDGISMKNGSRSSDESGGAVTLDTLLANFETSNRRNSSFVTSTKSDLQVPAEEVRASSAESSSTSSAGLEDKERKGRPTVSKDSSPTNLDKLKGKSPTTRKKLLEVPSNCTGKKSPTSFSPNRSHKPTGEATIQRQRATSISPTNANTKRK